MGSCEKYTKQEKHGVTFEEAAYVFIDMDAISIHDANHSQGEDRWVTLGEIAKHGVIVAVHTDRMHGEFEYIRIISERKATRKEKAEYIKRLGGK